MQKEDKLEAEELEKKTKLKKKNWNLLFLGIIAIIVTISTTGVSLAIYHNSGDIYLDRSRPGYLPDEKEIENEENKEQEYEFSKTGKMSLEVLEEYLKELEVQLEAIDTYQDPFGPDILSNEHLGIL